MHGEEIMTRPTNWKSWQDRATDPIFNDDEEIGGTWVAYTAEYIADRSSPGFDCLRFIRFKGEGETKQIDDIIEFEIKWIQKYRRKRIPHKGFKLCGNTFTPEFLKAAFELYDRCHEKYVVKGEEE